ncbi:MAG: ATP-binding cassette domain-containing protein [Verrucomicrobia bacterium]|jgi:phospholipid/cholesterol/gamma-HCH transport system ATP-binding protein|nr:ATP-binding cassette domain-containing protein [Verrucomicrobiota bacterium]OQC66306.1 MAG: Sulfate/thiosulfate import ATP-binding protein CysA [Verrucomicrobia bacterium ADurb.Bin006]MDI9382117.1 ATP-binding cassette domain-containing protein [Verrucomicrobiota bacterium]HNV00411.1 ATP-binding cassette domain-containing protein [Verrucomicrobiota bacterium]HOA61498.1 ATP-binding cassette domain-containing protein [Verrucomicrobiota bacterium]
MNATAQQGVNLRARDVCKSYDGQRVLNGIDFHVERGEVFVLMGPSGSGKTVLLKHLIGLEVPDRGEILIEGQPIHSPGVVDRYRLAMVFQSGALLNSLSVADNVGLYLSEHRLHPPETIARIVTEKLALVGLKGIENKLPSELSGGMKKRVSIARALVIEPQLILYDEPTSELDPLIAVTIGAEILRLNKRIHVTSIVVTHDRELAFGIADRIALMNEGELIALGPPDQVKANPHPLVQRFLQADFRFNPESITP